MRSPLTLIWAQQLKLVDKYIEKGKQVPYPVSIEEKPGQAFLRELFGFLEEEIFEAYEHIETMVITLNNVHPASLKGDVLKHLENFNEEVADTMAFWVEIFIYIGYDESTVKDYYAVVLEQMDMLHLDRGPDILQTAIAYSEMILGFSHQVNHTKLKIASYNLLIQNDIFNTDENKLPGNWISDTVVNMSKDYIFQSIKHLNIARNCLKMKFWRETEGNTNHETFYQNLMESWLNYQVFLYITGYTLSTQFSYNFELKNKKNLERIETKW